MDAFAWLGRPDMLFENIVRHGGTFTWLPNFAFNHLAATVGPRAATFKLAGVRAFINCSEPCKPASFDRFQAAFAASGLQAAQLQCCYAMAETVFAASQSGLLTPPARVRVLPDMLEPGRQISPSADPLIGVEIMSSGAPLPGVTVSVHDATGAELAPGTVGEIAIACPFLFTEYNQEPERSAACLRDGRYFTRDIGFVHQGQVYVLGRVDDLIIINGRNLYGHEVEAAVNAISGVKAGRAVAIGHFDARVGSQALIIIAERDPAVAVPDAQIRRAISQSVHAIFNVMPRTVHLVDLGWLIKTTSGKIGRAANLQKFLSTQNREVT
jgi:acyl-CoA synthetase (AMP-forming)/AMP-acid ligase II